MNRALLSAAITSLLGGGCYDGLGDNFQPPAADTGADGGSESGGDESGSTGAVGSSSDEGDEGDESDGSTSAPAETGDEGSSLPLSYQVHVKPLFEEACQCHWFNASAGFDLSKGPEASMVNAGSGVLPGRTIVTPGDPKNSFLVVKLRLPNSGGIEGQPMPYSFRLDEEEIALVEQWIEDGAEP